MLVRDIMLVNVPAVDATASIREAAEVLASEGRDVLLVVDDGRLAGVVSESVLEKVLNDLDLLEPLAVG